MVSAHSMDPRPSKLSRLVNKHPETQIEDYIDYRPIIVFNVIKKENKKNFIFLVSQNNQKNTQKNH